jgi:hypothetical protein
MKRDLKADLKFCNRATQGPWRHEWNPNCSEVYAPGVDTPIILVGHDPYDADFVVQAREGWPHAIERALEAEKRVEELENQVDILSTTLNMYCSPYYDMRERAEKAEALARELVEVLELFETVHIDTSLKDRIEDAKKAQEVLVRARKELGNHGTR